VLVVCVFISLFNQGNWKVCETTLNGSITPQATFLVLFIDFFACCTEMCELFALVCLLFYLIGARFERHRVFYARGGI
jgi:hypothetical protein